MIYETHPLGPEVGVLGLLLASVGPVHGVVLLKLHRLHLLLDGVHCGVCSGAEGRRKRLEIGLGSHTSWKTTQVSSKWVGGQ